MDYTRLGRTGLTVSRLALGTMNFGWQIDEDAAHAVLGHAADLGINLVDTANMYGREDGDGLSERIIGSWLAKTGARDRTVLATKVYAPMSADPNDRGLSARNIIASCEASLRRLGTDWIDLFQMHHIDRGTPWEEIWQAMETLTTQGKIRYAGSSNFAGWHLARAQAAADRRHHLGIVSEQCKYNLLTRHVELEVLPAAAELGIGILPYSPLHFGALSGALRKQRDGVPGRSVLHAPDRVEPHRAALQRFEDLCAELGSAPTAVAIGWLLSRPEVTAPILGPRTPEQLDVPVTPLPADVLARLDEIFPPVGNGGPAPEAWAW
ncbi:NDP-hexose 2,3-enoyl reductase [Actinoplanes octamycinicus]|uniref:NDP-hexose 2,3-enoyl reductase n=1 Tax=Actinoplanes octamycinicus TaxID=135948 RepID=A0A7W7H442_9ACTN|nr:aldo/keto reductase [Actinoplanes octamycinicus]MBB4743474.1 NDP-hexose 2,3-enoyl reductase [Actinoplanes octamycinicus]GIE62541.1 oxidoreductase [Actinoplanes octamycinicus]